MYYHNINKIVVYVQCIACILVLLGKCIFNKSVVKLALPIIKQKTKQNFQKNVTVRYVSLTR